MRSTDSIAVAKAAGAVSGPAGAVKALKVVSRSSPHAIREALRSLEKIRATIPLLEKRAVKVSWKGKSGGGRSWQRLVAYLETLVKNEAFQVSTTYLINHPAGLAGRCCQVSIAVAIRQGCSK